MATIEEQLNTMHDEYKQRKDFRTARALLQNLMQELMDTLDQVEIVKTAGAFDTLPTEIKTAMSRWLASYEDVKTLLLADADIMSIFEWRP